MWLLRWGDCVKEIASSLWAGRVFWLPLLLSKLLETCHEVKQNKRGAEELVISGVLHSPPIPEHVEFSPHSYGWCLRSSVTWLPTTALSRLHHLEWLRTWTCNSLERPCSLWLLLLLRLPQAVAIPISPTPKVLPCFLSLNLISLWGYLFSFSFNMKGHLQRKLLSDDSVIWSSKKSLRGKVGSCQSIFPIFEQG